MCVCAWLDAGVISTSSCVCRSELPREQYEGLRVELFSEIARSSGQGPRLVLIQLCRCLVAFAFATVPDIWPNTVVSMVHSLRDATRSIQVSPIYTRVIPLPTLDIYRGSGTKPPRQIV